MSNDRSREHLPPNFDGDLAINLGMGGSFWDEETGVANATIRCSPEQTETDGSIPFGYLSAIADNNNATANIRTADWNDNSILIEVSYQTARAARGTVEVRSHNSAYNDAMGVAQGVMLDDEGPFGQSQCTSVTVPARPFMEDRGELPQVEHLAFPWEADIAPAPVDLYLKGGLQMVEGGAIYSSQLDSGWASNYGSLHGGAIGLLVTRAMRYAHRRLVGQGRAGPDLVQHQLRPPGHGRPRADGGSGAGDRSDHPVLHPRGRAGPAFGQAGGAVSGHPPAGPEGLSPPTPLSLDTAGSAMPKSSELLVAEGVTMVQNVGFPVFDADNHMYESSDAFTKFLPREYEGLIKYVKVNGRDKIAVKNVISDYIPNPTFSVVARPGAQEEFFKIGNPEGKSRREIMGEAMRSPDAFFAPEPRLAMMDELGLDRALMWPTLASLLEERLRTDPRATHVVVHALNEWMHETWSFNYESRIFATPVVTLPIVDEAIRELDWLVERGAKIVLIRPAPVPGFEGFRSFALPEFDPFWERVVDADIAVGMHSSDDGQTRYTKLWEGGSDGEFLPFGEPSAFLDILHYQSRGIFDAVASLIGHGLLSRFPSLRILPVENGSGWVRPLMEALGHSYAHNPNLYTEDPLVVLKRNLWIHPFHEEDPRGLIKLVGADRVVFGSDYPHPEGMSNPLDYVKELDGLSDEDKARIMGGNLAEVMKVAA
jgi:predicted TIM-barrel fold metal-dependent hydrolase